MSPEDRRSKLLDILRQSFSYTGHNIEGMASEIEALFKQEEPLPDVHAGIDYRCIKDFYMDKDSGGHRAFTKGLVYNSNLVTHDWHEGQTCVWLTDDAGEDHSASPYSRDRPFWEYFEEVSSGETFLIKDPYIEKFKSLKRRKEALDELAKCRIVLE